MGAIRTWWRRFFLYEPKEFKDSVAGRFYEFPAIKYLSRIENDQSKIFRIFSTTKASYISADYFADSLINFLKDKGAGVTDMDRIWFCLKFNTYHIQPKTLKQFRNLFESSSNDKEIYKQNLRKWYNETMDRCNGWYKRKMRFILFYLGFLIALSFNVDSIHIAKILANDKNARGQLVSMGVALAKDSARYKDFIYTNGDSVHSNAIIDTGFSHVTKDINAANLVLGLGWSFSSLKKNDTYIIDTLKNKGWIKRDPTQIIKDSIRFVQASMYFNPIRILTDSNWAGETRLNKERLQLYTNTQTLKFLLADSLLLNSRLTSATRDSIKFWNSVRVMRKKIDSIKTQLIKDSLLLSLNKVLIRSLSDSVKSLTENKLLVIDSITNDTDAHIIQVFGKRKYGFWEKVGLVLGSIFSRHVFGFLITALALSLGAPFWFDLLNKLASIRGVGVKPEEKKQTVDDIPKPLNLVVPQVLINSSLVVNDIIDQALQIYASAIKSIPGVKSVFRVKDDIQVNVDNHSTQAFVLKQFPNITVNEVQIILKIVVSGIPKSQQSKRNAGEIYNANMPNFSGTLGCIIENSQTKSKHILSCWHVMKGNLNYDHDDNDTAINDYQGKEIGIRWAGGIDGAYDFAFAQLTPERVKENNSILFAKLNIINCKIKPLSNADINNQIAVKYFDCIYSESVQLGKIYTDTTSIDIEYKDKTRTLKDILILINNNSSGTQKPISDHGNSGSIVFDVKDGNAIAMIIAGDDYHTYAIKLANISSIYPEMKILN